MHRHRKSALLTLLTVAFLGLTGCATTTSEKLESAIRRYRNLQAHKAFALARDSSGAAAWCEAHGQTSAEEAERQALACCQAVRPAYMVRGCVLYAINDLFVGGAAPEESDQPSTTPAATRRDQESFGVSRVLFRIPTGRRIGTHYEGAGRGLRSLIMVPRSSYFWEGDLSFGRPEEFRLAAIEELKNQGLSVLGAESILFGEDEGLKAKYQLGGEISDLVLNTYARAFSSYSEASISIGWQVFDSLSERVVLSTRTTGGAKVRGVTREAVLLAFRSAVRQLAGAADFTTALRRKVPEAEEVAKTAQILDLDCDPGGSTPLPQGLEAAMHGVVIVRVGTILGSGFLISSDGYIVTAAHVVSGANRVVVTFRSGLEIDGDVVRIDNSQDVALLMVPGRGYRCLPLAFASTPATGTDVYAIGAPLGVELAYSVSKGIVSGMREFPPGKYLQTDAALNRGNSGGPLLDPSGRVVGMVSWGIPGGEGLAFGVPVDAILERLGLSLDLRRP